MSQAYDVLVVGAGPAGLTAAAVLHDAGVKVCVLDRPRSGPFSVGETFRPKLQELLPIGLSGVCEKTPSVAFANTFSAWGSEELTEQPSMLTVHGEGTHVDRAAFNQNLKSAAADFGVEIRTCTTGFRPNEEGLKGGKWKFEGSTATHLIDATGRHGLAGLSTWIPMDRLVGVAARFENSRVDEMLIESCETGWWYSAPQPNEATVVMFMTDSDMVEGGAGELENWWRLKLEDSTHTRARITGLRPAKIGVFDASTGWRAEVSGPNWWAAGDAAFGWDPLAGVGVDRAIVSGMRAGAEAFLTLRGEAPDSVRWIKEIHFCLIKRQHYYAMEKRWPDSLFWARRQAPNSVLTTNPEDTIHVRRQATDLEIAHLEALIPHKVVARKVIELQGAPQVASDLARDLREETQLDDARILAAVQALNAIH